MKLQETKTHFAGGLWPSNLKKVFFCLILLLPLAFYGCSGDDNEPDLDPGPDTTIPYSVTVNDQNKNMPSGGTIISEFSDSPKGSDIGKIVDNNKSTNFITNQSKYYIVWKGNKTAAINYYSLTSAADAPEKDPKSWTLSASNDEVAWTTLDEQENQTFATRKETKEYEFENKTEYKHYKLYIHSNGGDAATQIAEWRMEVIPTDIEDLMSKSSGHTYSPQTPMGNHYANRHVTTDENREWLKVADNEPPAPASASHLYLVEFPVNLFPYGTPLPADVNQHAIGNCGGIAALASMAYVYPDFVKSLIKDNGNKTYTVSMFDPQGKPVEVIVTSKFLTGNGTDIDAVSGKNNTATWSTVLEKAVMKWNYIYKVNTDIGGIGSEHVPPLFTGNGNSFAFYPNSLDAEQLARAVKVCLRQGYLVVGGFNRADLPVDDSKTVTGHAYTLMHSTDRSALFTMRNPWGGNPYVDGSKDGVLNIPNNNTIPQTIDLRITYPGIAAETGTGVKTPYIPPTLKSSEAKMRVADYLLRPTMRR